MNKCSKVFMCRNTFIFNMRWCQPTCKSKRIPSFTILFVLSKKSVSLGDILWNTTFWMEDFPLLKRLHNSKYIRIKIYGYKSTQKYLNIAAVAKGTWLKQYRKQSVEAWWHHGLCAQLWNKHFGFGNIVLCSLQDTFLNSASLHPARVRNGYWQI